MDGCIMCCSLMSYISEEGLTSNTVLHIRCRFGKDCLQAMNCTSRPKKTWREIVEKDCRARGLNTEDAMVRSRWREQIGMIDDHDECEWVNVSSGTGSPGLSRTDSTEP